MKIPGSGRKKGTPNKMTQDLMKICEEEGVDPFRALLLVYKQAHIADTKLSALKEICQYVYPKRKAIEHSGEINNPFEHMSLEELEIRVKEKLDNK